ncbi:MarR family winged helix-turn-helix transcriptional regulator [Arthrobacter sp. LAPM80]|uniref:MarR family winged helix-turn-helix transcriptional regulator n=1 Tax=Arthrobacter sp. LAPM80 TaxID=3141788 RepID=UPI00398B4BC7
MPKEWVPDDNDPGAHEPDTDYSAALIATLTRVLSAWTAPDFMTAVAAREGVELDPGAITMVTILSKDGPQRPSYLAAEMMTGASNISKISARLTAAGLLQRIPDPSDARAQLLELTAPGKKIAVALVRAGAGLVEELLRGWDTTDRLDLVRLLKKFEGSTITFSAGLGPATAANSTKKNNHKEH